MHTTCSSHISKLYTKYDLNKKLEEDVVLVLKEIKIQILNNTSYGRLRQNSFKNLLKNVGHTKQIIIFNELFFNENSRI